MAYCYFNGQIIEEGNAGISIHHLGATRGFGVFDFFRVRDGKPSFMDYHLDRFDKSQRFMDLSHMIPRDEILHAIEGLMEKNSFPDSGLKLVLFGEGKDSDEELTPFFYITQTNLAQHTPKPVCNLISHEYLREYPEVKTINYLTTNLLHKKKVKAEAIDVLFHKDGVISEAARSSVFIVKDGMLRTPSKNILGGITRENVLRISPQIIETRVEDVSFDDLLNADEAFITGTLKEVMPVVLMDGKKIGGGKIGPITQKIQSAFRSLF